VLSHIILATGIDEVVKAMSDGNLSYRRVERGKLEPAPTSDTSSPDAQATDRGVGARPDEADKWGSIEQVVGKAGDIVLLHPWCVHSGTTNFGTRPRLMLNGMARMKQDAGRCTGKIPLGVSSRMIKDTLVSLDPLAGCRESESEKRASLDD
jgi:hypothetical protein